MGNVFIVHSAKGSIWEKHKYVKKLNGNYYYPVGYKLGRTIDSLDKESGSKSEDSTEKERTYDLTDDDIKELANEVIRGDYGNGQTRKELLGDLYNDVQDLVNDILKSGKSSKSKKSKEDEEEMMEDTSEMESLMKKVLSDVANKSMKSVSEAGVGIDIEKVYDVYKKK